MRADRFLQLSKREKGARVDTNTGKKSIWYELATGKSAGCTSKDLRLHARQCVSNATPIRDFVIGAVREQ